MVKVVGAVHNDPMETTRSAPEVVRAQLSDWIAEGRFGPGAKISEAAVASSLGVSRNTVRESFRLLAHEGLLVHEFNRGVFVPVVTSADVRDVYRVRRLLETGVVRSLGERDAMRLGMLRERVDQGRRAAQDGDWPKVGTANLHFHRAVVALARSPRLDATMSRLVAEIRLLFAVIDDARLLYEPFVERNAALLELMAAGRFEDAANDLEAYLAESEAWLLAAFDAAERAS